MNKQNKYMNTRKSTKKQFLLTFCVAISSLTWLPQGMAQDNTSVESSYKLNYAVIWNGSNLGRIETTINNEENSVDITSITKAEGMASIWLGGDLVQTCQFEKRDNMILSRNFSAQKKGSNKYTNLIEYDWEAQKISFNSEPVFDMPQGYIVDNCNFHFAAAYTELDKLKNGPVYVMDGKKKRIRGYVFDSVSEERIETPVGEFDTTKIVLRRELDENKKFTFWVSPDKPFFPLKMMDSRKSRKTIMLIQSIEN